MKCTIDFQDVIVLDRINTDIIRQENTVFSDRHVYQNKWSDDLPKYDK